MYAYQELALEIAMGTIKLADCSRKALYSKILSYFESYQGNLTVNNATRGQVIDMFVVEDSMDVCYSGKLASSRPKPMSSQRTYVFLR